MLDPTYKPTRKSQSQNALRIAVPDLFHVCRRKLLAIEELDRGNI